jgi:hypothetical protein
MRYVELQFYGIFSIIDVGIGKSCQCIVVVYLIPHILIVVHCHLSPLYL